MKIAIVDDNINDRNILTNEINKKVEQLAQLHVEIVQFENGEKFLEYMKNTEQSFDVIFMDIYMGKMTGIDTSRQIRKLDDDVKIIFTTTSNEFASESYEVKAHDYLIKPYDKTRLSKVIKKLIGRGKSQVIDLGNGRTIDAGKVVYTTFSGHYVTVVMEDGEKVQIRCTQKKFEHIIIPFKNLVPTFKGVIANLNQVDCIEGDRFRMKDGNYVPISRRKYSEIKKQYTSFLIEKIEQEDI